MTLSPIMEIEDPVSRSPINVFPKIFTDTNGACEIDELNSVLKMEV
jgi:hypothetical protein